MIKCLACVIFLFNASAYDQKHVKFSDSTYQRYIRPQILNILSDYKKLVLTFNYGFTPISKTLDEINTVYESSLDSTNPNKIPLVLKLATQIKETSLKGKKAFLKSTALYVKSKDQKDLKNVYNQYYFMIIDNLNETFKDQFNLFWIDFISPIQREIVFKNDKSFLRMRLSSLNASWNSFNVHMNKRNVQLTKAQESRLEIIHRRWRSILKLVVIP